MPEISIILPSLRRTLVLKRIKEFAKTTKGLDYEIIVVSPFPVKGERVVHIYEEKQLGTIHAHDVAYRNSLGVYIMPWADDSSPTMNCLSSMLSFVKGKKDPFVGSFRVKDRRGRELVQWSVYGKLYACFGCASKNTLKLIGGYFDPAYKGYWADPDMGLRTWEKGGRVEVCPNAWVITEGFSDKVSTENSKNYFQHDTETFYNRWHDKLGKGIEKNFDAVNKPVGNGRLRPAFSFYVTLLNKMLVLYSTFVPEKVKGVVRLVVNKVRR
jgi:hypothetical protein